MFAEFAKLEAILRGKFLRKEKRTDGSHGKRRSMAQLLTRSLKDLDSVIFIRFAHWTLLLY